MSTATGRRRSRAPGLGAGLAGLVLLAGCGGSAAPSPAPSSASPTPSPRPPLVSSKAHDRAALERLDGLGLRAEDLSGSLFVRDGAVSASPRFGSEGPTFDYCGAAESSLANRVARSGRQVRGVVAGQRALLVEQVVEFRDEAAAEDAVSGFAFAVRNCDDAPHAAVWSDTGPLRFARDNESFDLEGPFQPNYLAVVELTGSKGKSWLQSLVIRHGRYLTVGWAFLPEQPGPDEGRTLGAVTAAIAARVQKLPA